MTGFRQFCRSQRTLPKPTDMGGYQVGEGRRSDHEAVGQDFKAQCGRKKPAIFPHARMALRVNTIDHTEVMRTLVLMKGGLVHSEGSVWALA